MDCDQKEYQLKNYTHTRIWEICNICIYIKLLKYFSTINKMNLFRSEENDYFSFASCIYIKYIRK